MWVGCGDARAEGQGVRWEEGRKGRREVGSREVGSWGIVGVGN